MKLFHAVLGLFAATMLSGCGNHGSASRESETTAPPATEATAVTLDTSLTNAYLHQDWNTLSAIVAPDYYGVGDGIEWDYAALKREFPKIHLVEARAEYRHVKSLGPDMLLINENMTIRETYDGHDISGRYAMSDIWVRRNGAWFLLVEQELPLK